MAECIHGFDEGMCDICFPRQVAEPEAAVATASTRSARTTTARRTVPARTRRAPGAPAASAMPTVAPFTSRRLYHVTHARNLESILLDGAIRSIDAGADPDVDVSAPLVRELRAAADVGDGRPVSGFVPFGLSPDFDRWAELRTGALASHWSAAARLASATEYVMLVVSAKLVGADAVVANGDASAPASGFTIGDPARAIVRAAREDPALGAVELLAPDRVSLDALMLIGVPNEPMRARVRRMFDAVETTAPKVVVHPPWFTPVEA